MATITIYATSGGFVSHEDAVYATADSASATTKAVNTTSAAIRSGNYFEVTYQIRQAFQGFDTSILVSPSTTGATCNIYCAQDANAAGGPWDWKLYENNWTGTLATTDFTLSSGLSSLTTLDTKSFADTFTSGYFSFSVSGHSQLTGTDTFMGMFLGAANHGTAPVDTTSEQCLVPRSFNQTGTTEDAYLTITDTGIANETLVPDSILGSSAGIGSGTISTIDEGVTSPGGDWLTVSASTSDLTVDVTFPTPTGPPVGLQTFRAHIRKTATGGGDPNWFLYIYENGTRLNGSTYFANGVLADSTAGETISGQWNASDLTNTDGSGVECRVFIQSQGGGPNARSGDIDAIDWQVTYEAAGSSTRYFFIT